MSKHCFLKSRLTVDDEDRLAEGLLELELVLDQGLVHKVDDNSVGWYQSTNMGNFMNQSDRKSVV